MACLAAPHGRRGAGAAQRYPWEKPHQPNLTGTPYAYHPPGSVLRGGHRGQRPAITSRGRRSSISSRGFRRRVSGVRAAGFTSSWKIWRARPALTTRRTLPGNRRGAPQVDRAPQFGLPARLPQMTIGRNDRLLGRLTDALARAAARPRRDRRRTARAASRSVCSPSSGGRVTATGESDSLTGQPTVLYVPRVG